MRLSAAADENLDPSRRALHVEAEVVAKLMSTDLFESEDLSGAGGARTPDLSDAIRTLFQLSYSPKSVLLS